MKEVALKLTQGEGPNKIFGLGELPTLGDSLVAPPYLMPFGAQYLREPKEDECLINKPEAVAALEWWQELRDKGAVPSPADLQNVAWPAFQFGKIAMTLQGSWATPPIRAGAKFNWDIAMWPRGPKAHVNFSAGSAYMMHLQETFSDVVKTDKTGLSKTAHTRWMISAFANFLPGSTIFRLA